MIAAGEQAVLDGLAGEANRLVERAIAWCLINSGSRNSPGLAKMATVLETELVRLPGVVERVALDSVVDIASNGAEVRHASADALLLTVRPEAKLQVVLTGHYDTVYPAESNFCAVNARADGSLHGPGIADMKGGISVMLSALAAFEEHPGAARLGYRVLLSPDEETGSLASAPILAKLARGAQIGLTYEPALGDGTLAGARKGAGNFHIVVRGHAAHAGRDFEEGRNAVVAAACLAAQLAALSSPSEGITVNVARIDGGGALNMVPDVAVVRLNVRFPNIDAAAFLSGKIAAAVRDTAKDGITISQHGGLHRPAKPFNEAQAILFDAIRQTGALLGQSIGWNESGGACEGNNLFAAGLPNVDTLGVRGGHIHSEREFAWRDSFVERAQLSAMILLRIANGAIPAPAIKAAMSL